MKRLSVRACVATGLFLTMCLLSACGKDGSRRTRSQVPATESSSSPEADTGLPLPDAGAIERALDRIGWTRLLPTGDDGHPSEEGRRQMQAMVEQVRKRLTMSRKRPDCGDSGTEIISIAFTSTSPEMARDLATRLAEEYVMSSQGASIPELTSKRNELHEKLAAAHAEARAAWERLTQFAQTGGDVPPPSLREAAEDAEREVKQVLAELDQLDTRQSLSLAGVCLSDGISVGEVRASPSLERRGQEKFSCTVLVEIATRPTQADPR